MKQFPLSIDNLKVFDLKTLVHMSIRIEGYNGKVVTKCFMYNNFHHSSENNSVAAVAEWYRYRTVACFVTGSSPVPLKTRRVGQRCTLNLSRAETSSRWCGVVVRRGGASSGVVHVT
ncbi:uncharacterized protein TNCV_2428821 [Trichonephila clavipes]|nr:uncharacterized protein TNCV_2428821 [Trichonephila clavipes]